MLSSRHFEDFSVWYAARQRRRTGRLPTQKTVKTRMQQLASVANRINCADPDDLGTVIQDAERCEQLVNLLTARLSGDAARGYIYALMAYADYAKAKGLITGCALSANDLPPSSPPKPITVYTPEEMETFVSAARGVDLRWWALLAYLVDTSHRIGETLSLEWAWFNLTADIPYIAVPDSKNREPQYIPLSKRLREEVFTAENIERLQTEPRARNRQFKRPQAVHPFPWAYVTCSHRFDRFCQVTGLPNRGFHNFRHTVITQRIARGDPIQAVASLGGYSNVNVMLSRYNHATALAYSQYVD